MQERLTPPSPWTRWSTTCTSGTSSFAAVSRPIGHRDPRCSTPSTGTRSAAPTALADLYPFYPPKVRLVRPKIAGPSQAPSSRTHTSTSETGTRFVPSRTPQAPPSVPLDVRPRRPRVREERSRAVPEGAYDDQLSRLETSLARLASCGTSRGPALLPAHYRETYDQEAAAAAAAAAERTGRRPPRGSLGLPGGSSDPGTSLAPDFAALLAARKARCEPRRRRRLRFRRNAARARTPRAPGRKGRGTVSTRRRRLAAAAGAERRRRARGVLGRGGGETAQSAEDAVQALVEEATRFIDAIPREGGGGGAEGGGGGAEGEGGGAEGAGPGARSPAPPAPEPEPVETRTRSNQSQRKAGKGDAAGNPTPAAAQTSSSSFAASSPRARCLKARPRRHRQGTRGRRDAGSRPSLCDLVAPRTSRVRVHGHGTRVAFMRRPGRRPSARPLDARALLGAAARIARGVEEDADDAAGGAAAGAGARPPAAQSTMAAAKDGEGRRAVGDSDEWRTQAAREAAMATRILETSDAVAAAAAEVAKA